MYKTTKLYYINPLLSSCTATILDISPKGIVTNRTVAFAEGCGQIGDIGTLTTGKFEIPFLDTIKGVGAPLILPDFPLIHLNTPVYHVVSEENLKYFKIGEEITISINILHRIGTTVHHTGIHLALMAAIKIQPDITKYIKGCSITEMTARLDFSSSKKLTTEDLNKISLEIQNLIDNNLEIQMFKHNNIDDAWDWKCGDFQIPCGGTHLQNTNQLLDFKIRRKTKGKGTERLIIDVVSHNWTSEFYS